LGAVIQMGESEPIYMLWNDPSVIKDGDLYRMWLSGGDARNLNKIRVDVYEASSSDGRSWSIAPTPVLSPSGNVSDWDNLRTETPSVVKVGGIYHLYYSGFSVTGAVTGQSQIGHATSTDGTNWVKDARNPILTGGVSDRFQWGYGGVGEPGIVYNNADSTFYLYYAGMRHSRSNPTQGNIGILLAKSTDGSHFTPVIDASGNQKVILWRDVPGAIDGAWFGYSAPAAYRSSSGLFQLFATFVVAPGGPSTARNVLLARAVSRNGVDFTTAEEGIFTAGQGDWKDHQVAAASALESDGQVLMWFAGQRLNPFEAGIGLAIHPPL
jgi:hypothetical protein